MRGASRGIMWALVIGAGVIAVLIVAVLIGPRPERTSVLTQREDSANASGGFVTRIDSMTANAGTPGTDSLGEAVQDEERIVESGTSELEREEIESASNPAEQYSIAIAALTNGDHAAAARGLEPLLDEFRNDPVARAKVRINLARAELALANSRRAIVLTEEAIALQETSDSAWNVRGLALLDAKRGSEAVAAFERAVLLNPNNVYAQNNLGYARILRGESAAAVAPLRAAREVAERLGIDLPAYVYNNLGVALESTGALEESADAYRHAAGAGHANASVSLARIEDRIAINDRRASVDCGDTEEMSLRPESEDDHQQ
ncbi:MAG: tetratricopeptide repeat protein [bacterium]